MQTAFFAVRTFGVSGQLIVDRVTGTEMHVPIEDGVTLDHEDLLQPRRVFWGFLFAHTAVSCRRKEIKVFHTLLGHVGNIKRQLISRSVYKDGLTGLAASAFHAVAPIKMNRSRPAAGTLENIPAHALQLGSFMLLDIILHEKKRESCIVSREKQGKGDLCLFGHKSSLNDKQAYPGKCQLLQCLLFPILGAHAGFLHTRVVFLIVVDDFQLEFQAGHVGVRGLTASFNGAIR